MKEHDIINGREVLELLEDGMCRVQCIKCNTVTTRSIKGLTVNGCDKGPCHPRFVDMSGEQHGKLLVDKYVRVSTDPSCNRQWLWRCTCSCGTVEHVSRGSLKYGKVACLACSHKARADAKRLPNKKSAFNRVLRTFKRNARTRGLVWELALEDFELVIAQDCRYCGASAKADCEGLIRNSVDRLDNAIGYTKSNAVPCCFECNRMKHTMSEEAYVAHALRVVKYMERSTTIESTLPQERKQVEYTQAGGNEVDPTG